MRVKKEEAMGVKRKVAMGLSWGGSRERGGRLEQASFTDLPRSRAGLVQRHHGTVHPKRRSGHGWKSGWELDGCE